MPAHAEGCRLAGFSFLTVWVQLPPAPPCDVSGHRSQVSRDVEGSRQDQMLGKVATLHGELEKAIRAQAPAAATGLGAAASEPVLGQLQVLLDGKAGRKPPEAEWQAAVKEGNERVARQEPPGYKDGEKTSSELPEGAAGDYLVWDQTIKEATRSKLNVLLVTGDEKEDWWWRYRSEFLGPHVELVAELRNVCGRQLYMMRPIDLLRRSSALHFSVRKESVDDIERVSREIQQRALWTQVAVTALLERLETEGRDQTEVIRVAALHGGTVSREDVYEICGYQDDRMLRGFTLPTAAGTASMTVSSTSRTTTSRWRPVIVRMRFICRSTVRRVAGPGCRA
jgi:PIN like domain